MLDLYLHRGSFETVLADEDCEQDADRWVSHTAWGQECFQILAQWLFSLRLDEASTWLQRPCARPHSLLLTRLRLSLPPSLSLPANPHPPSSMALHNGPNARLPAVFLARLLLCNPMARSVAPLTGLSLRKNADRSAMAPCVFCMRDASDIVARVRGSEQCQERPSSKKPRRVSAVFWPISSGPLSLPLPSSPSSPPLPPSAPLLWRDWPRRLLRRYWLCLIRRETVTFSWEPFSQSELTNADHKPFLTREQRAHYRLSWSLRLARNARPADAPRLSVLLHGLPAHFFETFGSPQQAVA